MKRVSRIAFAVIVVVVGLGAAGIAILKTFDFNQYREFVAERVLAATGRNLTIAGDLDLEISFSPSLRMEGVTLANAEWGSRSEMIKLGRLDAQVELIPLLSGEARITRIEISDFDALVETNAVGQGNWLFGETAPAAGGATESEEALPILPVLKEVIIENAKVTYRDGATGQSHEVVFESLTANKKELRGPLGLAGEGRLADVPFEFGGQVGNIALVFAGDSFPFALKATALAAEFSLEGVVEKPLEGSGVDVKVGVEAPDLAETLGALADAVPGFEGLSGPVAAAKVSGHIRQTEAGVSLTDFVASLGPSDLSGSASVDLSGARPRMTAEFTSEKLDLAALMPAKGSEMAPPSENGSGTAGESKKLFSSDPLPLEGLRAVDANLTMKVGEIIVPSGLTADNLLITAVLDRAKLTVVPLRAGLAGGILEGKLEVDGAQDNAMTGFSLAGQKMVLGTALDQMGAKDLVSDGPMDLDIFLTGQGASMAALMGSLDGHLTLQVGKGRLQSKAVEIAGADVAMQLVDALNPAAEKQDYSELSCAVVRFGVKDGVATADNGIAVETDKVNLVGAGTVDLGEEMLDLTVVPEANTGMGINLSSAVASLVRVQGSLAEPSVGIDKAGAAKAAASVGAALMTGGLSVLGQALLSDDTKDPHPCLTALGKAPPPEAATPASAPAEKKESPAESAKEKAKKAIEGVGDAIGNILGGKK